MVAFQPRQPRPWSTSALLTILSLAAKPSAGGFGDFFGSAPAERNIEAGTDTNGKSVEEEESVSYGVDVSFPIHHEQISNNYAWLPHNVDPENHEIPSKHRDMVVQPLGDRQAAYDEFLQGCVDHYGKSGRMCVQTERDRIAMSLRQPPSMQNYTELGFKKIRAPKDIMDLLAEFWDKNHDTQTNEAWPKGNTYTNHWKAPTKMVSVEDRTLRGGGGKLKQKIWDSARKVIEEWTGEELTQCSLYGIRVYTEGAILATHVDRMPLVSSAIINVAQDLDEPWPIEVYAHDGKAYNVTMEPGDMVLYESHSVLHGRPFPLKGRYYANIFIHFEPTGHTLRHEAKDHAKHAGGDVDKKYEEAVSRRAGGHEADHDGMPSYILEGSEEAMVWMRSHSGRHKSPANRRESRKSFATGTTEAHTAAQFGDIEKLSSIVEKKKHLVNGLDENGWTPLHEGARGGHKEVVELLVKNGANVNARTNGGTGATALWWANKSHGESHPVVEFLKGVGALSIGPEL